MKLIAEAKHAWKMLSVQAMAAAIAIQGAWMQLPEDMKASLNPKLVSWGTMGLLVLGIVGRLLPQKSIPKGDAS